MPAGIIGPGDVEFWLWTNTAQFRDPFTRSGQDLELAGPLWRAKLSWPALKRDWQRELMAFLVELGGPAGRFYLGDVNGSWPRGVATGTPLVDGAGQTGATLATRSWTHSVAGILRKGDYISFDTPGGRRELKMLTADASSDGAGKATLSIKPAIRTSPVDSAAITVTGATCIMKLVDDEQARWRTQRGLIGAVGIECVEALFG